MELFQNGGRFECKMDQQQHQQHLQHHQQHRDAISQGEYVVSAQVEETRFRYEDSTMKHFENGGRVECETDLAEKTRQKAKRTGNEDELGVLDEGRELADELGQGAEAAPQLVGRRRGALRRSGAGQEVAHQHEAQRRRVAVAGEQFAQLLHHLHR